MVALVTTVDGNLVGVHRLWLDPEKPAKADLTPVRKMLGPVSGHAVHLMGLSQAARRLFVSEGIETGLAYMQLAGLRGADTLVWAALSASGIANLIVPEHIEEVIVLCDNDKACRDAANKLSGRIHRQGRRVSLQFSSSAGSNANDFNDMLLAKSRS
jgi:hypothetical protein